MGEFQGWVAVAERLENLVQDQVREDEPLDEGQRASVLAIVERLRQDRRALLLADEVGMGKTRIAAALIDSVRRCGGRSAIVLPAGLGVQWQTELRAFNADDRTLLPLRSYESFIMGYGEAGKDRVSAGWQARRNQRLADRRLQRELPEGTWNQEEVIMLSHTFARMTFPESGIGTWRRELLPAVGARATGHSLPVEGRNAPGLVWASHRAADAIFSADAETARGLACEVDVAAMTADQYKRALLPLIGRALGQFDLIVIDEAHKARGHDSSLSRILGPVTWPGEDVFRLGMTATPVELDAAQWIDTLARVRGVDDAAEGAAKAKIENDLNREIEEPTREYAKTAKRLREEPVSEALVTEFEDAAAAFQAALRPYVIRRDKRSDKEILAFEAKHCAYREERVLPIKAAGMGRDWLKCFCAAEALSLLPEADAAAKRVRLRLDKGHGLDKLVLDKTASAGEEALDFWSRNALISAEMDLYNHPAIIATARNIEEEYVEKGRKVLVFGTLVEPLQSLTRLLDARALRRHVVDGKHWPARGVPSEAEPAVRAAMAQLGWPAGISDIEALNEELRKQYEHASNRRSDLLQRLHSEIQARAKERDATAELLMRLWPDRSERDEHASSPIGQLLDALEARRFREADDGLSAQARDWTADALLSELAQLLKELATDPGDRDESAGPVERHEDKPEVGEGALEHLEAHLKLFSGREGNFARLLYGGTTAQTRNLLQAAFNRPGSWPMVLVAQSAVGREGLNLHEECRTVVLLHAEWNPAVVEQQIGRVDRKESRWSKDVRDWELSGARGTPPRIEIVSVEVEGGYDSLNWSVLRERWAALRAQLHGDVILPADREKAKSDPQLADWGARIDVAAPSFYPK